MADELLGSAATGSRKPFFADLAISFADEQWARLNKRLNLSNEARANLEGCVGWYRFAQTREALIRETAGSKSEIEELCRKMSELASDLDQLLARARNVDPMVTSDLDLELLAVELRYQSDRIEKSQDRFKNMKRGPKKQLAHQFVALIAMFLEMYTDQLITRSDKDLLLRDFIVDLCAIADPHIGRSTIDQALKAHVRRRRGKNNP